MIKKAIGTINNVVKSSTLNMKGEDKEIKK